MAEVGPGSDELRAVPKVTRYNLVADDDVACVLIGTVTTAHTGDVVDERSVPIERQLTPG